MRQGRTQRFWATITVMVTSGCGYEGKGSPQRCSYMVHPCSFWFICPSHLSVSLSISVLLCSSTHRNRSLFHTPEKPLCHTHHPDHARSFNVDQCHPVDRRKATHALGRAEADGWGRGQENARPRVVGFKCVADENGDATLDGGGHSLSRRREGEGGGESGGRGGESGGRDT
jgi:hypothetical protein